MLPQKLSKLLATGDFAATVSELRNGRLQTSPASKTNAAQYDPKAHVINDPIIRPDKMVVVDSQSDNYGEVKTVNPNSEMAETGYRIERVARIALAIQKLIVKRAVAFTFGNPVTYTCDTDDEQQKDVLQALMRVFYDVKESTLNRRIARALYSTQEVAELWYPVETPRPHTLYGFSTKYKFKAAIFSPALGDTLWPYFDDARDLVAFSREFSHKDGDLVERNYFETYTDEAHYLWCSQDRAGGKDAGNWEMVEGYPKKNPIGKIPIVYASQPQTEWADVQPLIDRLEKLLSNFADTNDYHASPKIFVRGAIKGFCRKGEAGGIIEGEDGAEASYLSWASAPESVKLEIDTLLRMIYTITQTPDISFDTVKGIGAVSGVALRLLFMDAHLKVQDKAEIFDEYLQRRCNIVKEYIAQANQKAAAAASELVIKPKITPYIIEDELSKINILQAANGGKQIASRLATIKRLGWADDPEAEEAAIQAEEASDNSYLQGEPTF